MDSTSNSNSNSNSNRKSFAPPVHPPQVSGVQRETMQRAVSSAFDDAAEGGGHDPALVAAITASVIKNLKASGIGVSPTLPPSATSPTTAPASQRDTGVYTPPSPEIPDPLAQMQSHGSFSAVDMAAADSNFNQRRRSTTPPTQPQLASSHQQYQPAPQQVYQHGQTQQDQEYLPEQLHTVPSQSQYPPPPLQQQQQHQHQPEQSRPPPVERAPTDDTTTLEKIWQPLFEADGTATKRLSQFLRGLANHMIDDYEPKKSLVISPQKMLKFYDDVRLAKEQYPWAELFGGKVRHGDLSHIYRDLDCEHHFIQPAAPSERPSVPALTPVGFERWMTLIIRSHPDLEYDRFSKAVLNMPISNADDVKERFPKELSRRLFPKHGDYQTRILFDDSIYADGVVTPVQDYARPEPPPPAPSSSQQESTARDARDAPAASAQPPRHRNSVHHSAPMAVPPPSSTATASKSATHPPPLQTQAERDWGTAPSELTSEDLHPPSGVSLERERKPYTAQPGQGKVYGNEERAADKIPLTPTTSRTNAPPPASSSSRMQYDGGDDHRVGSRYRSGSVAAGTSVPPPRDRYRSRSHSRPRGSYARSDIAGGGSIGGASMPMTLDDDDRSRRYVPSASTDDRQRRYDREPARPFTYEPDDYSRRPRNTHDYQPQAAQAQYRN